MTTLPYRFEKSPRNWLVLAAVSVLLASCAGIQANTNQRLADDSWVPVATTALSTELTNEEVLIKGLSVDVASGADGTPLPPPNKAVGDKWPPEVKRFIDGMLQIFVRGERPPISTHEIETMLGVKLTPLSFNSLGVAASYRISGSDLLNPLSAKKLAEYRVGSLKKDGRRFHAFEFPIDPTRYCVSPYDFAIYTGNKYSPEVPVHGFRPPDRHWPLAYEWGMFDRTSSGRYLPSGGPFIALITSKTCIVLFRAHTNTIEGAQP